MHPDPKRRYSRIGLWLPPAVLAAYLLFCVIIAEGDTWRPEWDSAIYLLTGQSLASGQGYVYLDEPFTLRPPGLSWLLSLFVTRDGYDFGTLNLMMMLCASAAIGAVYFVVRHRHGPWVGLAAALLTGTCPLYVSNFNFILSEMPFTALLFLSIGLFHIAEDRPSRRWWPWSLAGSLTLAAALYMRTIGIILLPGIVLLGFIRHRGARRWRGSIPVLIVVGLTLPWILHANAMTSAAETPPNQLLLHSYTTAVFHQDPGDPASDLVSWSGWIDRILSNGGTLLGELTRYSLYVKSFWTQALLMLVLLAGFLIAVGRRAAEPRTPDLLEWLAVAYTGVLLLYFTYVNRLVMPLMPLVYVYLFVALLTAARRFARLLGKPRLPAAAGLTVFVLLLAANLSVMPITLDARQYKEGNVTAGQKWDDLHAAADWIRSNTGEDDVILCRQAPIISLLSGRRAYTYRFRFRPEMLDRYRVRYAVFAGKSPRGMEEWIKARAEMSWVLPSSIPGRQIAIYRWPSGS